MCEFCTKHGEGKKWYLNVKNYSLDLLNDARRRHFVKDFFYWVDRSYKRYFVLAKSMPLGVPVLGGAVKSFIKRMVISKHWGQVVPIEDVEKILSIANSITRVPCACRQATTGKEVRTCYLLSIDPKAIGMAEIVDRSYFGGPDVAKFENMDKKTAMRYMSENEHKGYFHTVWTHGTPFVGGLCNCNDTGCVPFKMYKEVTPLFFKAEYMIDVDEARCVGCKECIKICPFGALVFDHDNKKAKVLEGECYGCGICRSVCKANALRLG